jgi:hypothetical protein
MTGSRFEQAMGDLHDTRVRVVPDADLGRGDTDAGALAVAPSGVFVVHIESGRGVIHLRRDGWFVDRRETLFVGPRDRTAWVRQVASTAADVRDRLVDPSVPMRPVVATVDVEWPWRQRGYTVDGVIVTALPAVRKHLVEPGPLGDDEIARLADDLAVAFAR